MKTAPLPFFLALCLSSNVFAQSIYWDGTSTDFSLISAWSTSATSATPNPSAIPGAADIATFKISTATSAQTVNLNGTQSVLGLATTSSNNNLTTIQGGGTNQVLNLGASGINHVSGGLNIGSSTSGQQVDISLQGAQTWTSSASGTTPTALTIFNNVSLGMAGTHTLTLSGTNVNPAIHGVISDGAGVLNLSKTSTVSGSMWTLNGHNTYSGTTTVSQGILIANHNNALGSTLAGTSVASGASLSLGAGITVTGETISITDAGTNNVGALLNQSGTTQWAGTVILNGTIPRIGTAANAHMILSGSIQDGTAQNLFLTGGGGTGIITISAAEGVNTYTGLTNLVRGTLRIGATNALPIGTILDVHALAGATENATFDLNNFNQTVAGLQNTGGTNVVVQVTNSGASMRTFTINNPVARSFSGIITGANLALTKTGAGTMTLSGANTYGGVTRINGGTLALGAAGSIANTSEVLLGGGTLNVSAKGAPGLTLGSSQKLSGSGSVTGNLRIDGTLAIGNSPGTITFNNNLTLGAGSTSDFEFTDSTFTAGTFDLAQGTGDTVTFDGTLNLLFSGGGYALNSTVNIFPGFATYGGSFDTINVSGLAAEQSASFDSSTGLLTIIPIPEPGAPLLLAGGLAALSLRRRRRE